MSKLRKGVIKSKDRKSPAAQQKKTAAKQTQTVADAAIRDNFLFRSSVKSYLLAVVFFIMSVLSAGKFWPFGDWRKASGDAGNIGFDIITGVLSFLFFMFFLFAWGNSLEIRGNVIEWKHVIVSILFTTFIAIWGGAASFILFIVGVFALLTLFWYMSR
jgi:hypothetical protein